MTQTPNYYSIIPATVRYCKDLSPQEKLLYSEITALTNFKGYCWATNNYFADLYGLSKKTISRQVSNLVEHGFIRIEMIYFENSNQIKERRIYLPESDILRMDKNADTPMDKNADTPMDKNAEDNNTRYNNTSMNISYPITSVQSGSSKETEKRKTDEMRADEILPQTEESEKRQKNKESFENTPNPHKGKKHLTKPSETKYNYNDVLEIVKENIDYDYILMDKTVNESMLDEILHAIVGTICTEFRDGCITMGEERVPAEQVKNSFFKLTKEEIEYYAECFNRQTDPITKTVAYIRTALYRNYRTTEHHYANRVHVDMPQLVERNLQKKE